MTSLTQVINTPLIQQGTTIAEVQKQPSALLTTLSFLTDGEKQACHLLSKTWDQLSKTVEKGYGDYILVDTTGADVDYETYKTVFSSLNNHLPQVHQQSLSNRLQETNEEIHIKYPRLQALFIPRALYELNCLLSIYREELALAKADKECNLKSCFHSLNLKGGTDENNLKKSVVKLAFRLNQFIIKELALTSKGLTELECQRAGQNILAQFQQMNKERFDTTIPRWQLAHFYPMMNKVRKGVMIDPINLQKVIKLECSPDSENAVLLYRGSRYQKEPLYEGKLPYCACFGTSLFAGFLKDSSACAGARMFYDEDTVCSYSLSIPLQDHWQDAFCIPRVNTVCGLVSECESFHARAKCVSPNGSWIRGYASCVDDEVRDRLVSPSSESELSTQLNKYQEKRIEYTLDPKRKQGSTYNL